MTLKKQKILHLEKESIRWHYVDNSFWKRLWVFRKAEWAQNMHILVSKGETN